MSIAVGINQHIYVLGNTVDPQLILANNGTVDETVNIGLFDINGSQVVADISVTVPAGGTTTVQYGDTLGAQTGLTEGFYVIRVAGTTETFFIPLIITGAVTNDLITITNSIPATAKIHTVLVQHKPTGLMILLPPSDTTYLPYTSDFTVIVYVYDYAQKKGQIWIREGIGNWTSTKFARKVLIEYTYKFNSISELAGFLVLYSKGDFETQQTLAQLYAKGLYQELAEISQLWFVEPASLGLGRILDYKVDLQNLEIKVKAITYMGFGWEEIKTALKYAGAGAIVGAGIGASAFLTIASAGTGAIVAGAILGASLGTAYSILKSDDQLDQKSSSGITDVIAPDSKNYIIIVKDIAEQGKQNLISARDQAINTLNQLLQNGEITQSAYDKLLDAINNVYITGVSAIDDTANECATQLDQCVKDYRLRLMIGTAGGGVVGYIIGK